MKFIKENRIKKCQECEIQFEANRLDMKFCSRKCRNRFHNRRVRAVNFDTQQIDNVLHRNYRILKTLGPSKMIRSQLAGYGFNFRYITHMQKANNGGTIYCLYDYCYYYRKDNQIHIFKQENQ